jgi:hypothetical protein
MHLLGLLLRRAREEGAVLYAKLSDIITKSQFTEMQKDAEINR